MSPDQCPLTKSCDTPLTMEFTRVSRGLVVLLLLGLLGSLLVYGGIDRPPAPELGDYPGIEAIGESPERYQGQAVLVAGSVVATEPVVIRAEDGTGAGIEPIDLTISAVGIPVERGDHLQVFGVLVDARRVQATNVVVVPRTGLWYTWTVSFLAGLWVLARISSHWRVDSETAALVPRSNWWRPAWWRRT